MLTGVTSPGSGNETGIAQIVADGLGCKLDRIRVIQGDTESCPWGFGNYSARSIIIGGSAAHLAALDVREKMLTCRLEHARGGAGGPRRRRRGHLGPRRAGSLADDRRGRRARSTATRTARTWRASSRRSRRSGTSGSANVYHQPEKQGRFSAYPSWPNGVAACIVEVDPETGFVEILRFCMVHDAGTIVNPLLADANLHGGIAQGIGAALYEKIAYDEAAPAADGDVHGLHDPDCRRGAEPRARPPGDADAVHAARHEGRGRVGRRRAARRALQRDRERAARSSTSASPSCR